MPEEAAYFYTLGLVKQYQEQVLGKRVGGFGITPRWQVLRDLKNALRLGNASDVQKYLKEYYRIGGDQKGLKSSMRNMNLLQGLSRTEQAGFLKGISPEDKKYLNRANAFFHRMADRFWKQAMSRSILGGYLLITFRFIFFILCTIKSTM